MYPTKSVLLDPILFSIRCDRIACVHDGKFDAPKDSPPCVPSRRPREYRFITSKTAQKRALLRCFTCYSRLRSVFLRSRCAVALRNAGFVISVFDGSSEVTQLTCRCGLRTGIRLVALSGCGDAFSAFDDWRGDDRCVWIRSDRCAGDGLWCEFGGRDGGGTRWNLSRGEGRDLCCGEVARWEVAKSRSRKSGSKKVAQRHQLAAMPAKAGIQGSIAG